MSGGDAIGCPLWPDETTSTAKPPLGGLCVKMAKTSSSDVARSRTAPSEVAIVSTTTSLDTVALRRVAALLSEMGIAHQHWGWPDSSLAIGTGTSRSGLRNRLRLVRAYGHFLWSVLWRAMAVRGSVLIYCEMFEAALPVALASIFSNVRFIFFNGDNLSMRYGWPVAARRLVESLERFVVGRSSCHIIPHESRWKGTGARIIQNTPSRRTLHRAQSIAKASEYRPGANLTIYVNGWLSDLRGLGVLHRAVSGCRGNVNVLLAGQLVSQAARELAALPCCEYVGFVDSVQALAMYARADVVFTYYDPALEINRLAAANKWCDCILFNVPFIVNAEVVTAQEFRDLGACFSAPYSDEIALRVLIEKLAESKSELEKARGALRRFGVRFWEDDMRAIFQEFACEPVAATGQ